MPGIELFPLLLQLESLQVQRVDIEKQLGSLEVASVPQKDELDRLKELKKIISAEEKEIGRLTGGSKKLKEKVGFDLPYVCNLNFLTGLACHLYLFF